MNDRKVLPPSKVIARGIVLGNEMGNLVADSHFETNQARTAKSFMALKLAKGAQGE